jgi:uncharacterized RDD family membrane protein YckC
MTDYTHSQIGQYAGFFSRLLATAIDVGIVALIVFLSLVASRLVFSTFGFDCVVTLNMPCTQQGYGELLRPIATTLETIAPIIGVLFTPTFAGFYLLFFWAHTGQTPGKAQMGVRVVRLDGEMMTWLVAFRRLIGYSFSILPFLLGFGWILVDDQRRGIHDRFAGTCVIYSWDARPDEHFLMETLRTFQRRASD